MMDQIDRLPTAEIQSFSAETILAVNDVTTLQLHGSKEIKLCVADLESEKAMLLFMEKPKLVGITKWRFEWKGPKVAKFKRFKQIVEKMTEKEISDDEDEKKDKEEKVEDVSCVAVQ
ncbi:hypothetical protein RHGRI_010620 [Rhododendron griersonianum]|uniref:Uncharacterized protein n=2 Tax=Rhododendron griersonianum TaxID=479676 RepID=A0AAV6HM64_9ERIC|nr:hypothetical protein RHGRI_038648 [Rhododendron griersonianum]KAG5552595.1 hypothetical protein RHGRI_010620 [Rhododendron griersonianum]